VEADQADFVLVAQSKQITSVPTEVQPPLEVEISHQLKGHGHTRQL